MRVLERRAGWLFWPALAAACTFALTFLPEPDVERPTTILSMDSDVVVDMGPGQTYEVGENLPARQVHILVPGGSKLRMQHQMRAVVELLGPAQMQLAENGDAVLITGNGLFAVEKRYKTREEYSIVAGDTKIVVLGTQFGLNVNQGKLQHAAVTEGLVRVHKPGGESQFLKRGQSYAREPGSRPVFMSELRSLGREVGRARNLTQNRAKRSSLGKRAQRTSTEAKSSVSRCTKENSSVESFKGSGTYSKRQARSELTLAECLLGRGKGKEASRILSKVMGSFRGRLLGGEAQLMLARHLDSSKRKKSAIKHYAQYSVTYPHGRDREFASFRTCELFRETKSFDKAQSCLKSFEGDYPSSRKRKDVALLRAHIAGDSQNWLLAANLYRKFLRMESGGVRAEEAHFFLIQTMRKGKVPGADLEAAIFLKRWPQSDYFRRSVAGI